MDGVGLIDPFGFLNSGRVRRVRVQIHVEPIRTKMLRPPRRFAHYFFAALQSALTSSIAAAIASSNFIWTGGFFGHWLQSWTVAWIVMLPVVIIAAPAILRLSEFMTHPDTPIVGDRSRHVLSSDETNRDHEARHIHVNRIDRT